MLRLPMLHTSAKSLLTAGALSVFALAVGAPAIDAGAPGSFLSAAFAQQTSYPIIVNVVQFSELAENGAKIVDVRQKAAFEKGHIPGAVNLPWASLNVSERDGIRNEFQEDAVFEKVISAAGLENGDTLVIYDNNSLPGRAFIALEYAGFKNIHVLDGGIDAFGSSLETGPAEVAASNFKITDKHDVRVDKAYVEARISAPDAVVVDGRNSDAFVDGHIPGAKSLVASRLLTDERKLQPEDVINKLLASRGIDKEKEILSYCGSGVAAANNYIALRNLGYTNVRIYDESWDEWSRDPAAGQSLALGNYAFTGQDVSEESSQGPRFLTADQVKELAANPNVVVVDVRSPSDYSAGQIPGSVNVFWDTTLDENRVLKDTAELKKLYQEAGVTPDKQVILFTRGGVQLTHSYTVLSLLGFQNVDFFTGKFEGWENGAMRRG
ncbi:rhodanese-like domain-containing protein [Aquamicrobium ahrensii]|uniref:3-mercaptopyruvate sulfurtransferase SseA n=1 Tax=Aquamicrobium ahrensii TaxID=469551 RepID=A0ABV2KPJ6_9HYPH